MGEVSETTMTMTIKKKKKKGRPSLLDLQKRSIKQQQQQQQNPNSFDSGSEDPSQRRSTRRNPNLDSPERISGDDDDERKEKKHKLLLGLNPHPQPHYPTLSPNSLLFNSGPYGSDSNAIIEDPEVTLKRRKISVFHHGSDAMGEKFLKVTDTIHGLQVESESGPTTPLPDKKLLVFILDRLQKKDTYGVFSEPVDPEDLPDYHDIVENPMDFGTVRKKLDEGAYANLERFENDVLLICTNAMQYNASDTIFFRQARSMQELAKKDFENLRQESDDSEPQPKVVRRGRPPGKSLKKSLSRSPLEHVCPEPSLDATLASGGDNASGSNAYNLRKGPTSYKFQPADASVRASHGSHNSETCTSWWSEWENEFPASVLKSVLKYGKKQFAIDENRRDAYKYPLDSGHGPSVLATLEGELKQLMAVGLHLEHGYARSLTRFAADLGPVVWKIASKKIESVLPVGLKFGPGWIGENEVSKRHQSLFLEEKSTENLVRADHTSKLLPSSTFGPNSVVNGSLLQSGEDFEIARRLNSQSELTSLNNSVGEIKPVPPFQIQHKPTIHSDINGLNGGFVSDFSSQRKMVRLATLTGMSSSDDASLSSQMLGMNSSSNTTIYQIPRNDIESNEAKFSENPSRLHSGNLLSLGSGGKLYGTPEVGLDRKTSLQGLSMQRNHDSFSYPPDLNGTFWAPGSPSSNVQIGSPQHPDLALQL